MQFKPWMAPAADLAARLAEGEVAIRAEDGAIVRRPDGQPTAPPRVLGTMLPTLDVDGDARLGGHVVLTSPGRVAEVLGSLTVAEDARFSGSARIGRTVLSGLTAAVSAGDQSVADRFSAASFRSARYDVQISSGSSFHVCELRVLHDGAVAHLVEYGEITTGGPLGTFSADLEGGDVRVLFTPLRSDPVELRLFRVLIEL